MYKTDYQSILSLYDVEITLINQSYRTNSTFLPFRLCLLIALYKLVDELPNQVGCCPIKKGYWNQQLQNRFDCRCLRARTINFPFTLKNNKNPKV